MTQVPENEGKINEIGIEAEVCECDAEESRELREAKARLTAAKNELEKAERDVEEALKEIERVIERERHEFDVEVLYDGEKKRFHVRIEETVGKLREEAIKAFKVATNPHMLGLYKDGKELSDSLTIKDAGIKPCEILLLRPSEVRGGA